MKNRNWLGWLVIVVAVIMVAQTAWQQKQNQDEQNQRQRSLECLSAWAVGFGAAIDARTSVSASSTAQRREMDDAAAHVFYAVPGVLAAHPKSSDVRKLLHALADYRVAYTSLNKTVGTQIDVAKQHPYPKPPTSCVQ